MYEDEAVATIVTC